MDYIDEFDFECDDLDINYQLALFEILSKLKTEWDNLKNKLFTEDKEILKSITNIDNLLNYYCI